VDTTQFLDYLSRNDATAGLGDSLTALVSARRTAEARRAVSPRCENEHLESVAS
jgi:hypothetical protein